MNQLLRCKIVDLGFVGRLARELEKEYDYVLSYFYDAMEKDFRGDILKTIKNSTTMLCNKINWIINEINEYGDENGRRFSLSERERIRRIKGQI